MTSATALPSGQRIPNLPEEQWSPKVEALFPLMLPPGSTAKGSDFISILLLAHHQGLADPSLRCNANVAQGFVLSARYREIAILQQAEVAGFPRLASIGAISSGHGQRSKANAATGASPSGR